MIEIIYSPADGELAGKIQADLAQRPLEIDAAVLLLSPQSVADDDVQTALARAIDANRRVVPVLVKATSLPALIEHLEPVDFTQQYAFDRLEARLGAIPREMHMKVHTPKVQATNKRTALIVAFFAVVMFLVALYAVGVLGLQAPAEEFAGIETEYIQTRNAIIDGVLPHTTEEATNFQATVDGAASTMRPLLIATATAAAAANAAAGQ